MAVQSTYFKTLVDQIDPMTAQSFFRENPFASVIAQKEFDTSQGVTPTAVVHTGSLPTSYPFSLAGVNIDNGPGSPSGDVSATTINTGQTDRTYALEVDAWDSNEINQDDQTFKTDPQGTIKNVVDSLMQYTVVRNSDWLRVKNIKMIDTKVIVKTGGGLVYDENQDSDFEALVVAREATAQAGAATTITLDASASAVDDFYNGMTIGIITATGIFATTDVPLAITDYDGTTKVATVTTGGAWPVATPDATSVFRILNTDLPTAGLDWDVNMHIFYNKLARRGAKKYAFGMAEGKAVYSLTTSPEVQKDLFKDQKQTDIRYYNPKANFTVRGITGAVDGFMPNEDDFVIRYDALMRPIYPTVNSSTTRGYLYAENPDYDPTAKGGAAVYETFTILAKECWEQRPRPLNHASHGDANFVKAQDYTAELAWTNNRTYKGTNDRGNKGYWRADWQKAAKPLRPENGFTGLVKIS